MNEESVENRIDYLKESLKNRTKCNDVDIRVVVAPLRICPLGAHIDHQKGMVTGMALDEAIILAFIPSRNKEIFIESDNFEGISHFEINNHIPKSKLLWENYARGAAEALSTQYNIQQGFNGIIDGRMPIGGLSSSAAVGISYLLALEEVNNLNIGNTKNIELDKYIENTYFGLKNGILDQSIILMSQKDKLTFLDCRDVKFEQISSNGGMSDFAIIVAYSGLSKSLVSGNDYNNRVNECQEATKMLADLSGISYKQSMKLRDIPYEIWLEYGKELPLPIRKRSEHFFTENDRVAKGVEAWRKDDIDHFGDLINESGESSVCNYESGCPHLTTLFNILKDSEGVYGARFSGAGFRGSCIGLINPEYKYEIKEKIDSIYPQEHPDVSEIYSVHFCSTGNGARVF